MRAKSKLPKSKAKTAYGLLSEVRRLILAEPKRYNQHDVLSLRGSKNPQLQDHFIDYPDCGTVGCVAGWVTTLKSDPRRLSGWKILDRAADILGINQQVADCLFNGYAASDVRQTRAHARSGAAHIARFQKRYAAQLKAKRV